jgi:hypothetical protein
MEQKQHRIGIVSMMKNPDNIDEWLQHHRELGITEFYIRLEKNVKKTVKKNVEKEKDDVEDYLRGQQDVVLTLGDSSGKNEYKEIQKRQQKMVDEGLKNALQRGTVDWLIHIDADELLYGSLDEIISFPPSVRVFWMDNEEAVYDDIPKEGQSCFQASRFRNCQQMAKKGDMSCASYANGKAGGRVAPDVRFGGPHRFFTSLDEGADQIKLSQLKVRHYESCNFDSYKSKFINLVQSDTAMDIPFSYYNESIQAAKTGDEDALECVYTKYRTELGDPLQTCT